MIVHFDIQSDFEPHKKYAIAGDNLILWKDCGNVWIVENRDGIRFPMSVDEILQHMAKQNHLNTGYQAIPTIGKSKSKNSPITPTQQSLF